MDKVGIPHGIRKLMEKEKDWWMYLPARRKEELVQLAQCRGFWEKFGEEFGYTWLDTTPYEDALKELKQITKEELEFAITFYKHLGIFELPLDSKIKVGSFIYGICLLSLKF